MVNFLKTKLYFLILICAFCLKCEGINFTVENNSHANLDVALLRDDYALVYQGPIKAMSSKTWDDFKPGDRSLIFSSPRYSSRIFSRVCNIEDGKTCTLTGLNLTSSCS